jgi:hypothetical protein
VPQASGLTPQSSFISSELWRAHRSWRNVVQPSTCSRLAPLKNKYDPRSRRTERESSPQGVQKCSPSFQQVPAANLEVPFCFI